MIGLVMLIGIVKKNAIMMIDVALVRSARAARRGGGDLPRLRAAVPADHDDDALPRCSARCRSRSGHGAGAELRQPLGIAVVGGLMVSQP